MTEITEDRDFKTNINVESQTINYIKNPEKFKEDLQKAKNEVEDLGNAVKNTSDPLGKDKRNIFENLRAQRWVTSFYNVTGSRMEELGRQFKAGTINEEDLKEAVRELAKGYGKDHGKDALEGRQDKKVAEDNSNKEKGLESLGKPANDYVKNKLGEDNNSKIKLSTDGIDLSNADVGEKVGDKANEGFNIYRDDIRTETKEKAIIKTGVANPWITYTEKEIQETINKVDGKDSYVIDWKRYSKDAEYREQTNYYFYQAKHFVKAKTIDKIGKNYIEITRDNGEKLKLTEIPAKEAIYHNIEKINGEWYFKFGEDVRYKKYVNEDGYELILDQNNKPVYDPVVVGTYNFFTYNSKLELANWGRHLQDIKLWKKYGTGPNDPTTREEREEIGGAMLGISINFYYKEIEEELQTRDKNKVSLNELQEIISNINEKKLRKIINIIKK